MRIIKKIKRMVKKDGEGVKRKKIIKKMVKKEDVFLTKDEIYGIAGSIRSAYRRFYKLWECMGAISFNCEALLTEDEKQKVKEADRLIGEVVDSLYERCRK